MKPTWLMGLILLSAGATPALAKVDVATLEAKARAAYRAGDFQGAADAFGALLVQLPADDPARARTQYNRGRALQQAGRACAAAEALFGYLSNPQSKADREARRLEKAQANLAEARAECERRADEEPPAPAPVVEAPVEPKSPKARPLLLEAGLGSGIYLSGRAERARTTLLAGGGWTKGALLLDLVAEFAIETPAGAETLAMIRPGVRWALSDAAYLRGGLPILLAPLVALGVQGGAGVIWPSKSPISGFVEAGPLAWFSSPVLVTFEARFGVQARF